jgi:GTP cyclohydrolase-4
MVMRGLDLSDTHAEEPEITVPINKVGLIGIKMPIHFLYSQGKRILIIPTFDVFINLPANQKGIHPSRNYEVITEVLSKYQDRTYKLEDVCSLIAEELLKRHKYASWAEVKAQGEAVYEKRTLKTKTTSFESFNIMAKAVLIRKLNAPPSLLKTVGVGVTGMTACPCTQQILRNSIRARLEEENSLSEGNVNGIVRDIPIATHVQRSYGSIMMEIPDGAEIDVMRLVEVIENSMSSSTFELLKRPDEVELVINALNRPRFVEDCIRYMIKGFVEEFSDLPDYVKIHFFQRNEESIHRHDIMAERRVTLGKIRSELK